MAYPLWLERALSEESEDLRDAAPPLRGAVRAQIAIVGGGMVGLWTALRIRDLAPGADVVILERDVCGSGASGRNGGEVLSWWAKAGKLATVCGSEEALRLCQATEAAIEELRVRCLSWGIDARFRRDGWLWTAVAAHQVGAWDSTIAACEELGASPFVRLPPEEVARRAGSSMHLAGVLEPSAATVDPGRLVRGLRRVALDQGIRIFENTAVSDLGSSSPAVLVAGDGQVIADRVVLCTNAWAASVRGLRRRLVAISSDIVVTPPIADRLDEMGWRDRESISDSAVMIHYYRRTDDGRVSFGKGGWGIALGGRIGRGFERDTRRAADVEASMRRIYPNLADVPIETHWSGPIDRSPDGLPVIGFLPGRPHVVHGVGWSGNGVGPSLVGSRILAALAMGIDDEWSRSSLVGDRPNRLPPEPLRYVGAHVVRSAVARMEGDLVAGRTPRRWDALLAAQAPEGIIPKPVKDPA